LPATTHEGLAVVRSHFANEGLAAVAMTEALRLLFDREPQASVAVICANEENARKHYSGLHNLDNVRLVIDGEFEFKPGIDVTDVAQIKGLEFDYVIIPDVNEHDYPDTPVARRSLHIAVTRTVHQLWILTIGRESPILEH
jgi:DNA helicase IV